MPGEDYAAGGQVLAQGADGNGAVGRAHQREGHAELALVRGAGDVRGAGQGGPAGEVIGYSEAGS